MQAYTPKNIGRGVGGPQTPLVCYSLTDICTDFTLLQYPICREEERVVNEGRLHVCKEVLTHSLTHLLTHSLSLPVLGPNGCSVRNSWNKEAVEAAVPPVVRKRLSPRDGSDGSMVGRAGPALYSFASFLRTLQRNFYNY